MLLHIFEQPQILAGMPPGSRLPRSLAMSRCGGAPNSFLLVAAEVRRVFITYTAPGARRVQVFAEHQSARFL